MKKLDAVFMLFNITLFGCMSNEEDNTKYNSLKSQFEECQKINDNMKIELVSKNKFIDDLKNTPQQRLGAAQKFMDQKDFISAKNEYQEIINRYNGTEEANTAEVFLKRIMSEEEKLKIEEERKKTFGIKGLKETLRVVVNDVTLNFNSVSSSKTWTFDSYGTEYHYRSAERDNTFIVAKIGIEADSKDPILPAIGLYYLFNGEMVLAGVLRYEFSRWDDYGSYLGNYADYSNDFSHSKKIQFSCGFEVPNKILNNVCFVIVKKQNCFTRTYEKFKNPPVSYTEGSCNMVNPLNITSFDSEYVLIKTFNKSKL